MIKLIFFLLCGLVKLRESRIFSKINYGNQIEEVAGVLRSQRSFFNKIAPAGRKYQVYNLCRMSKNGAIWNFQGLYLSPTFEKGKNVLTYLHGRDIIANKRSNFILQIIGEPTNPDDCTSPRLVSGAAIIDEDTKTMLKITVDKKHGHTIKVESQGETIELGPCAGPYSGVACQKRKILGFDGVWNYGDKRTKQKGYKPVFLNIFRSWNRRTKSGHSLIFHYYKEANAQTNIWIYFHDAINGMKRNQLGIEFYILMRNRSYLYGGSGACGLSTGFVTTPDCFFKAFNKGRKCQGVRGRQVYHIFNNAQKKKLKKPFEDSIKFGYLTQKNSVSSAFNNMSNSNCFEECSKGFGPVEIFACRRECESTYEAYAKDMKNHYTGKVMQYFSFVDALSK